MLIYLQVVRKMRSCIIYEDRAHDVDKLEKCEMLNRKPGNKKKPKLDFLFDIFSVDGRFLVSGSETLVKSALQVTEPDDCPGSEVRVCGATAVHQSQLPNAGRRVCSWPTDQADQNDR